MFNFYTFFSGIPFSTMVLGMEFWGNGADTN
jgi:hypothetical protein